MKRTCALVVSSFVLLVTASRADAQWAQFRGPNGSGVDASAGYPVEFSPTKNVAWKIAVPYGQSSPVIVGTRLVCHRQRRRSAAHDLRRYADRQGTVAPRGQARPRVGRLQGQRSRVADAGRRRERRRRLLSGVRIGGVRGRRTGALDRPPRTVSQNFYGMAGSPIIAGGLVVLVCDQQSGSFVVAIDRQTGRVRWRTERPGVRPGWATPIVFRPTPATHAISSCSGRRGSTRTTWRQARRAGGCRSDPATHSALRWSHGDTLLAVTLGSNDARAAGVSRPCWRSTTRTKTGVFRTPSSRGDKELGEHFGWIDTNNDSFITVAEWNAASSIYMGEYGAVAVRPGAATGRLQPSAIRWRFQKNMPYIPAPLLTRACSTW